MTDDKPTGPVMKRIEDMESTDSFVALMENATPIPGIRPAGNIKTYCKALVGDHIVEVYVQEAHISEKPIAGVIGSFTVSPGDVHFRLVDFMWSKFEVNKVKLCFELKPDNERTIAS